MKKLLLVFGLLLFVTCIFAQRGLFDIAYGDSIITTITNLEAKGFDVQQEGRTYLVSSQNNSDLPYIKIYTSNDSLYVYEWGLHYNLNATAQTESLIIAQMVELHGDYDVRNDYDYDYIWYLNNDRAIYVYIVSDDRLIIEYTFGNWDDDDFYYYYDFY